MDPLKAAFNAACGETVTDLKNEIRKVKESHHADVELLQTQIGEVRSQLGKQDEQVNVLQKENTDLKAAKQSKGASGSGDAVRKELDQLKHAGLTTKQSYQNRFGALEAKQNRQMSLIEELTRKTASVAQSSDATSAFVQDVAELKRQQSELDRRVKACADDVTVLTRASEDNANEFKRMQTAVTECRDRLDKQDYRKDLEGMRLSITALETDVKECQSTLDYQGLAQVSGGTLLSPRPHQTASRDLTRTIEEMKTDMNEMKKYRDWQTPHSVQLVHDVANLQQDRTLHAKRIYDVEYDMDQLKTFRRELKATNERIDDLSESVKNSVWHIHDRLDQNDADITQLQAALRVIKWHGPGLIQPINGPDSGRRLRGEVGETEVTIQSRTQTQTQGTASSVSYLKNTGPSPVPPQENATPPQEPSPKQSDSSTVPSWKKTTLATEDAIMGDDGENVAEPAGLTANEERHTVEEHAVEESTAIAAGPDNASNERVNQQQLPSAPEDTPSLEQSMVDGDETIETAEKVPMASVQPAPIAKSKRPGPADGRCHNCNRTESSQWRTGPNGARTLCYTCGRKYWKQKKELAATHAGEPASTSDMTTAVRDGSVSSDATFETVAPKVKRVMEAVEKSLKRKPALSPLTEQLESTTGGLAATNDTETGPPPPPTVNLTRTGYDLTGPSQTAVGLRVTGTFVREDLAGGVDVGADVEAAAVAAPTKRKRVTADQRARISASKLLGPASGFEGGKKRRRVAVTKNVRFDVDDELECMQVNEQRSEDEIAVLSAGANTNSMTVNESGATAIGFSDALPEHGSEIINTSSTLTEEVANLPELADLQGKEELNELRQEEGGCSKSDAASTLTVNFNPKPRTRGERGSQPSAKGGANDDQSWDVSEDNIVVSPPGFRTAQSSAPASPLPEQEDAPAARKKGVTLSIDLLSSPDPLSVLADTRPDPAESSSDAASAANQPPPPPTGQNVYRTLLAQFNLDHEHDEANAESVVESIEGRPKRQPKPKKFGDVVDVRTLTAKQLGK